MKRTLLATTLLTVLALGSVHPADAEELFPRPAALQPAVDFWTRVYSEVGTDAGLIHDSRKMDVVYEVIELPKGLSRRQRERHTERAKGRYEKILRTLAGGKRKNLSREEARVLALWPEGVSNRTLRDAIRRIRFQLGQADKFRAGLIRSGAYKDHIKRELRQIGVPVELAALPHVESSYTPHAHSHVGAAGLWQFTRSTGRRFMRVDHVVDERLDPHSATLAAARLLQQNYQVTGAWPLAITAYNHGASGMRRAVRKLGTSDIATIVEKYQSRTFGFASRNFYTEFLAALQVDSRAEHYFGKLVMDVPIDYARAAVSDYVPVKAIEKALGVDRSLLQEHNPALLRSVWEGSKRVPRGFVIQLPRSQLDRPIEAAFASIPAAHRYASQTRDRTHKVRRGETLSQIAARYGISMRALAELNGLRNRNRIRVGQKLSLPVDGSAPQLAIIEPAELPADGVYTVRRGDTLSSIGRRYGVSANELASLNRLRNRNRLSVGQRLIVSSTAIAVANEPVVAAASPAPPVQPPEPEPVIVASADPRVAAEPLAAATEALAAATEPVAFESEAIVLESAPIAAVPRAAAPVASLPAASPATPATPATPADPDALGPAAGNDEIDLEPDASKLLADPSNYAVDTDDTIEVQATETLGHYAEWLGLRASRLRQINGLRFGTPIGVGRTLELDFSRVTREAFEQQRLAYHRDLQEAFFEQYEITGTETYTTRRGDSLWSLAQRNFRIPVWLLRQYNPDVDFGTLHARTKLNVPTVRRHGLASSA